jgi:hypothetical protein
MAYFLLADITDAEFDRLSLGILPFFLFSFPFCNKKKGFSCEAPVLQKWPSIVSDTYLIPILADIFRYPYRKNIEQLILFKKKIND